MSAFLDRSGALQMSVSHGIRRKLPHPASHGVDGMSSLRTFRSVRIAIALALLCFPFFASVAQAPSSSKPFSKDDIIKLLTGDVAPVRVEVLARQRGIDFPITPDTEAELRQAGANDSLLAALRSLVPKPAAPAASQPPVLVINSTPDRAKVYIDDELIGTTTPEGLLRISTLAPGKHTLRLAHTGYADAEREVNLISGQATSVDITLLAESASTVGTPAGTHDPKTGKGIGPITFEVLHWHWQHLGTSQHAVHGTLTLSSQGLQYHEHGDRSDAKHDFKVSCTDIRDLWVDAAGPHLLHVSLQKGRWTLEPVIDGNDNSRKAQPILDAIKQVCALQ
jgi:hypothetical protein